MEKRESFNSKWGFILACIGSAVGMGNLWMFPTRVSLYGGGSFLIPYFIFVALIGSTGVIGEMCLGRGTRSGPIDAFGAACETRGRRKLGDALGFIPAVGSLAMAIGYTVVMGWILKICHRSLYRCHACPDRHRRFCLCFRLDGVRIWKQWLAACRPLLLHSDSDVRRRKRNRERQQADDAGILHPVCLFRHLRGIPAGCDAGLPLYFPHRS